MALRLTSLARDEETGALVVYDIVEPLPKYCRKFWRRAMIAGRDGQICRVEASTAGKSFHDPSQQRRIVWTS